MPPRRLFTLTRGIQIRGQPIKNLKKKIENVFKKFSNFFFIFSNFLVRTLQRKKNLKN
jgi:hypothetical protein